MTDFSIEFDEDSTVKLYLLKVKQNIIKASFLDVKIFFEPGFAFFHIKPLMWPLYWLCPFIWVAGYVIQGELSLPALLIGAIPGFSLLFYIKYWYIMGLYIGKWKGKYKGNLRAL